MRPEFREFLLVDHWFLLLSELLGGLASDGIRRSVVCLTSKHLSLHPTALALVVGVCIVPCSVFLCWIVFWAAKSVKSGSDGLRRYLSKRSVLSAMVIWYVTLVPVLKTALSVFLCVDVHDSVDFAQVNATHMYWAVDTGMRCYEGDHAKLLYRVVVAFVCPVYGGLLALFIFFLLSAPQHLAHKSSWAYQTTGFLYRCYRVDRRRYWEVAVFVRKTVIAVLVAYDRVGNSVMPTTGIELLLTFAIVMQILAAPFREGFQDLNRFEVASLSVSLVTMQIAIALRDEDDMGKHTREVLTDTCLALNLITFFVFVVYMLKFAAEYVRHRLTERGENCAPEAGAFRVLVHWIRYEIKHLIAKSRLSPATAEFAQHLSDET